MLLLTALALTPFPTSQTDAEAADRPWFEDVAAAAGVDFVNVSDRSEAHRFPEIMGGGVALFDYDGDGDLDLYLVQGGFLGEIAEGATQPTNRLYRNDTEEGELRFVDVTEAAGVGHGGYGMGAACADFDRDGDVDLYVTNVGPNVLYRNNGDGTFADVSEKLGVADPRWATSAAFFDADGKGGLDLYVVNNLAWSDTVETPCFNYYQEPDYCSPNNYNAPSVDVLYTYGRLGYTDRTALGKVETAFGNGLGVVVADYDQDGDQDVYVANDATANVLWQNGGRAVFENVAMTGGCAVNGQGRPEAGMGVQFADLDNDEDLDLFITHLRKETNTFYRNKNGLFDDKSNMVGTNAASLKLTGFGMGIHDFDHDGVLDLYVANGAVQAWKEDERYDPADAYAEPNHVFKGKDGRRGVKFQLRDGDSGSVGTSRGAAFGDLDGDGDVDVVLHDLDASVKVLRNVANEPGA
ncbi:MAG: VCBS repeat-containing protein, partial [Planctomycetota bacterium]